MTTKIYCVWPRGFEDKPQTWLLVRAGNKAAALRAAVAHKFGVALASQDELVEAMGHGAQIIDGAARLVETATAEKPRTDILGAPIPPPEDKLFIPPRLQGIGQS